MQLTERKSIRLSKQQINSLNTLELYGVNVPAFIRDAIKEKIKREWKGIKAEKERFKPPF